MGESDRRLRVCPRTRPPGRSTWRLRMFLPENVRRWLRQQPPHRNPWHFRQVMCVGVSPGDHRGTFRDAPQDFCQERCSHGHTPDHHGTKHGAFRGRCQAMRTGGRARLSHHSSRRDSMARPSVTSSAYSSSPPTGRPLAKRVTRMPSGLMMRAR